MNSCCQTEYNTTFSDKRARVEIRDYLKKGPKKSTGHLIEPLKQQDLSHASLLDIGGGVGAIAWELMDHGIEQVYYQEISQAYAREFLNQANQRSLQERVHVHIGDFVEQHQNLPATDVVTLDKVICCYEDFRPLVTLSAQKALRVYAYTIPLDVWWVKMIQSLEVLVKRVIGNNVRTYVHPVAEVEKLVIAQGFEKVYQRQNREWLTVIFNR